MKIPLMKPYLPGTVSKEIQKVLDSGFLTEGRTTREFEESISEFLKAKYVLAVCNCTAGIEIALRAIGVGPGHEVIVPDFTYPATANAALITGASVTLVDVSPHTMLIDHKDLEAAITDNTKAVLPVSLFGNPLDFEFLSRLKERYGFYIIEDAACSLGAMYGGRPVGTLADITVFSLHPRKFITTGEGGLITTNDRGLARWMDSYRHFGMEPDCADHRQLFNSIGGNYKLSNVQAAIGLAQMTYIEELLKERAVLAKRYKAMIAPISGVSLPLETDNAFHSYQTFVVFVEQRDRVMQILRRQGIEAQIGSYSLHTQPAFKKEARCNWKGTLSGSLYAYQHSLALPLYNGMTRKEQESVVSALKEAVTC